MDRRPPLPVSSSRLRTRFPPPSGPSPSILSQISLTPRLTRTSKKRKPPLNRSSAPLSISRRSTAARVNSAAGDDSIAPTVGSKSTPLFERGRLYDLYSARRNERLERKMAECSEAAAAAVTEDPVVAVVLAKRRLSKKAESARKSVLAHSSGSRGSSSRSAAVGRSKEKRKAGSSSAASGGGRRKGSGSVRWL